MTSFPSTWKRGCRNFCVLEVLALNALWKPIVFSILTKLAKSLSFQAVSSLRRTSLSNNWGLGIKTAVPLSHHLMLRQYFSEVRIVNSRDWKLAKRDFFRILLWFSVLSNILLLLNVGWWFNLKISLNNDEESSIQFKTTFSLTCDLYLSIQTSVWLFGHGNHCDVVS